MIQSITSYPQAIVAATIAVCVAAVICTFIYSLFERN